MDSEDDTPVESTEERDWAFRTQAQKILVEPRRQQLEAFQRGFCESVPCVAAILPLLSRAERRAVVSGDEEVGGRELAALLRVGSAADRASEAACVWLRRLVCRELDGAARRALLQFTTGLRAIPAQGGFCIQVIVEKTQGPEYRPSASTCQRTLHLGMYRDEAQLHKRLREALQVQNAAFDE